MKEADLPRFLDELAKAYLLQRVNNVPAILIERNRQEIIVLLEQLRAIGLFGGMTTLHPSPPELCDHCAGKIEKYRWFVDGATDPIGAWANMCLPCFITQGKAVGWGHGQLYMHLGNGVWRLVIGGDPCVFEDDRSS